MKWQQIVWYIMMNNYFISFYCCWASQHTDYYDEIKWNRFSRWKWRMQYHIIINFIHRREWMCDFTYWNEMCFSFAESMINLHGIYQPLNKANAMKYYVLFSLILRYVRMWSLINILELNWNSTSLVRRTRGSYNYN